VEKVFTSGLYGNRRGLFKDIDIIDKLGQICHENQQTGPRYKTVAPEQSLWCWELNMFRAGFVVSIVNMFRAGPVMSIVKVQVAKQRLGWTLQLAVQGRRHATSVDEY
jgi:hypothetical protein